LLVNAIVLIGEPEQVVWATGVAAALAKGLTTTVAVVGVTRQPLAVAVMVNVTVTGALVVLTKNPVILLPEPLAAIPPGTVATLSLVQVNIVPVIGLVKLIGPIDPAEQIVCVAGVAIAIAPGLTITVAVVGTPTHPFAVGVMVNVTVSCAPVKLVNAPLMLPLPLAAIPVAVAVLFLVQL